MKNNNLPRKTLPFLWYFLRKYKFSFFIFLFSEIVLRNLGYLLLQPFFVKTFVEIALNNRKEFIFLPNLALVDSVEEEFIYLNGVEKVCKNGESGDYSIYLKNTNILIGNIAVRISNENSRGEIGYFLDKKYTKKGYMKEAIAMVEKEFFVRQGINRLEILVDEENKNSNAVAMACDYHRDGILREYIFNKILGNYRNIIIYSKLKNEVKFD